MHGTSIISGSAFLDTYGISDGRCVDIGGTNINGSLSDFARKIGMIYICVDIEPHPSVDVVIKVGDILPFADQSIDIIVSTSCFEHDPCFWLSFKEMTRIVKPDGYIYVNAPTSGPYHSHPGDYWRFYSDAGQALAYWSGKKISNEQIFPVKVIETFNVLGDSWNDFVCVWKRVPEEEKEKSIVTHIDIINNKGKLEEVINMVGLQTRKKVE
jgi:SAM-dependent methyltransferase